MTKSSRTIPSRGTASPVRPALNRASMRLGWCIAERPRSFGTFLDLACRYWLDVRRELGISRGDRSAQDTRDIHEFIGAAASSYAAAPLSCADLTGERREECLAVAGFARLMAADAAVRSLLGRYAGLDAEAAAGAVAAFQQGYAAARSTAN